MSWPRPLAIILSFVIYLLPVFTIHAGFVPWPAMLLSGEWGLVLVALAAAVLLQGLTAYLFNWILRANLPGRLAGFVVSLPILFIAVNALFLYVVPVIVLIEPDWSGDVGTLDEACTLENVSLMRLPGTSPTGNSATGKVWVQQKSGDAAALMSGSDCTLEQAPKVGKPGQFIAASAAGSALYSTWEGAIYWLEAGGQTAVQLTAPADARHWRPILTMDGKSIAWLDRGPAQDGGKPHRAHFKSLTEETEKTVKLDLPTRASLTLTAASRSEFTLARYRNEILVADATGNIVWGPVSPEGTANADNGFRRIGADGWIAWDTYREDGVYRFVWSLPWGTGSHVLPRGRSIESADVSPDGRLIAYSSESNTYFNASGRLTILSTDNGAALFRRELKQFSRTHLAFLGSDLIAMEEFGARPHGVSVYRLPPN
jgi:hypothetical protein